MELVEGRTLRSVIGGHALAIPEALRIATEIAAGLAQAHQAHVVHRDLKPENVILGADGHPKILDFGLAKLVEQQQEVLGSQLSKQETRPEEMTRAGKLLGTPAYMSPEQARGEAVDARSDLFSFGVVLYEMVTGRVPFQGRNLIETLAAILDQPAVPASRSNAEVPSRLEELLGKCLEKNPGDRYQSCQDLVVDLRRMGRDLGSGSLPSYGARSAEGDSRAALSAAVAARSKTRQWLGWAVAALLLLSTAILASSASARRRRRRTLLASSFRLPRKRTSTGTPRFSRSLPTAPGWRSWPSDASRKRQLWVRSLDSLSAQLLPGTEGARQPFWSPDSRFLVFESGGKLRKIDVAGGRAQALCDASGAGGSWNREGVVLFSSRSSPVHRVSAAGGTPTAVTVLDASRQQTSHLWPHFLPDGNHFLYLARSPIAENNAIWVGSLDGKDPKQLLSANSSVQYAPPGYLLFVRDRTLMAQPFDAETLELTGDAFPVAERVQHNLYGDGRAAFAVSQTGLLAFRTGSGQKTQLTWFDRGGETLGAVGEAGPYYCPELSPDGTRLAVELEEAESVGTDIWLMDLLRGGSSRITFDPGHDVLPLWSPDGSWLAFSSDRMGDIDNIFQTRANGAGDDELFFGSEKEKAPWDWSSDGRFLLFTTRPRGRDPCGPCPCSGIESRSRSCRPGSTSITPGSLRTDGGLPTYPTSRAGTRSTSRASQNRVASARSRLNGGIQPRWRRDGRELFFLAADGKLMAVPLRGDAALEIGTPAALFEARLGGFKGGDRVSFNGRQEYDVTADGQRFLLNLDASEALPITVVLNWTAGLETQSEPGL